MGKGFDNFGKKGIAGFQISLMLVSFFSFVFIIASADIVQGGMLPVLTGKDGLLNIGKHPAGTVLDSKGNVIGKMSDGSYFKLGKNGKFSTTSTSGVAPDGSSTVGGWAAQDSGLDAIGQGLSWAAYAYMAGQLLGPMLGLDNEQTDSLSMSLAAGFGVGKALATYGTNGLGGMGSGFLSEGSGTLGLGATGWGVVIAVVVLVATYEDTKTETVTFSCQPWQAPNGGDNCELCNDNDLPCSEYRCKSLGQSCELVNEGTEDEKCVHVNPHDVTPPVIKPNYDVITTGHEYKNVKSSPPGPGFEIVNTQAGSNGGCLAPFTPLEFGLTLNEPGQCKIDFNSTTSFDDMVAYVGGSNLYLYNHTETLNLPNAKDLQGAGFSLVNGKDMSLFVRCMDKNGNTNDAEYEINFCVDPTPDSTAPRVEATSIANGGCVAENTDAANVTFYLNEPSECRWSFQDKDFDLMTNQMVCSNAVRTINAAQLFGCSASLGGIARDGVDYYVRCKDQPGKDEADRNKNTESYKFSLRGSTGLVLKNIKPNKTVFGGVSPAPVELHAETLFGCNKGKAVCTYSDDGKNYITFYDTDNEDGIHTQRLDLAKGDYTYYVRCADEGGNLVKGTINFTLDIDTNAPSVARVYEEDGMLKIVTSRKSECAYSPDNCDFTFDEGVEMPYANTTTHVTEWSNDMTYYIKCRDEFLNEGAGCSAVVRPTENFL